MAIFKMKYGLPAALLLALSVSAPSWGQIGGQFESEACISIGEAFKRAASGAPGVQIATARIGESEADFSEAESLFRPRVTGFGRSGAGNTSIVDTGVSNQLGARASQRLFDFGDAKYARLAARSDIEAREYEADREANSAIVQTALAILQLQQVSAQQELTYARRNFFAQQYEASNKLLNEGGATITEIANIASRLAETDAFNLELKFQKERAETEIQSDIQSNIPICEHKLSIEKLVPNSLSIFAEGTAVDTAIANNPSLKALEKRIENLDALNERQKRDRLPVLEVVGTSSYSSFDGFDNFDFNNRVGLDVSVPLIGGTFRSSTQRASARLNVSRAEKNRAERELEELIKITLKRIRSLEAQIPQLKIIEEQMFVQFESAQREEVIGTKTLSDIIDIRLQYEQAGLRRINNEFDLEREKLNLLEMTGVLQKTFAPSSAAYNLPNQARLTVLKFRFNPADRVLIRLSKSQDF